MFEYDRWDYDGYGEAFIIRKNVCPDREKVASFLVAKREVHSDAKPEVEKAIEVGWCAWQCRTDWENLDGEPVGGYYVTQNRYETLRPDGRKKPGWFDVWIVRTGDWY